MAYVALPERPRVLGLPAKSLVTVARGGAEGDAIEPLLGEESAQRRRGERALVDASVDFERA